ncbi:MAG: SDR family oxidoreductase [Thermodesulfobacteriota bacterium]
MNVIAARGVNQHADPKEWKEHRYGLTLERWTALAGKSFLVTGAGTGYGKALATALASAGGRVFMSGRRMEKLLGSIEDMKALDVPTGKCHAVRFDLTDIKQILAACEEIKSKCSSLYGLVNNAALPPKGSLITEEPDYWNALMRTNVTAPWFLTKEIFPHMMPGGSARVLFITSEAGWAFTPGVGPYNVSKAALNNLSASMANEYAETFSSMDIQMNALDPSEAKTEMNRNSPHNASAIVSMALMLLSHPQGGPNGKFFHRDGRHLKFAYAEPYEKELM